MPLPTSPSKRILDQALSHQETYQPSSAQVKAKFPAFSPSSPRPSPSASRPIQEGGSAAPYHHRPYAPPAFINPGKIGSEGMGRQAVRFLIRDSQKSYYWTFSLYGLHQLVQDRAYRHPTHRGKHQQKRNFEKVSWNKFLYWLRLGCYISQTYD